MPVGNLAQAHVLRSTVPLSRASFSRTARRAFSTTHQSRKHQYRLLSLCLRQLDEPRSSRGAVSTKRGSALHTERPPAAVQVETDARSQPSTSAPASNDIVAKALQQLSKLNPSRLSPRVRGLILLNILVLLCGANWVVLKEAEDFFDPFTFAALRFSLAAAVFSPWIKGAVQDPAVLKGGLELGLWSAMAYMLQSVGLMTSDASRASFLSTFTVLVVPLLAGITGRGVKPLTWASCVIALVGVGLLEQGGAPPGIGDVWNLLSAVFFGLQVFRTEHYSHHIKASKTSGQLGLIAVIVYTIATVALLATAVAHPGEIQDTLMHPQRSLAMIASPQFPWRQIAFTGLLSTDFVIYIELIALHDVTSIDAAIVYTLEPVLGATLAYILLGERWGPSGWVGAGLIVSSSLATQVFGQPDKPYITADDE